VEYILLVTMLGIGVVAGLAALRDALVTELNEIATLISAIH
jgi:Flp pilus assembly pilin Flp